MHPHPTSDDVSFVAAGSGRAVCDGNEEVLTAGNCHVCRRGSSHSIINTGSDDLVLWSVVMEH